MQIYFICDIVQKEDGGQFNTKIDFQLKSYASERNQLDFIFIVNCQALSISQSLNLPLSLRDRDRADTIITLYHTTPHHTTTTRNFLSTLELTYTQV